MRLNCLIILLVAFTSPVVASAEDAAAESKPAPRTGIFTAEFTERSPHSDPDRMATIAHWDRDQMPEYKVADHTFQLVVPKDYDGSEAYGVLVFIHPNNDVSLDRFYGRTIQDLLTKHKLIWVSYSDAGNPVLPNIRLGLALDAVHNVQKRYRIDDQRVYVSGLSGGGRMTCYAGIYYPEVFTGAIPIVGTNYFKQVKVPNDPTQLALLREQPKTENAFWPQRLFEPSKRQLKLMTAEQRWVLLAGEKDFNMPEMRAHYEQGFKPDGFEHAHYLEVPGMGHEYPDAEWFDKALALLDKPLIEKREAIASLPPADERTQRLAQRRLEVALRTLERDEDRGRRVLERLIEELPNTEAAKTAKAKLDALASQ